MQEYLKKIAAVIEQTEKFRQIDHAVSAKSEVSIANAAGSLSAFLISLLYNKRKKLPILCVLPFSDQAEKLKDELTELMESAEVTFFPEMRFSPWGHHDSTSLSQQLEVIEQLLEFKSRTATSDTVKLPTPVVITTAKAAVAELNAPEHFLNRRIDIRIGDEIPFDTLFEQLYEMGFERQPIVEQPGEISVRGGIIDIFPYSRLYPVRVEFWGDQVESIREFDPATQRSDNKISKIILLPQEVSFGETNGTERKGSNDSDHQATLADYLPDETLVCLFKPEQLAAQLEHGRDADLEESEWLGEDDRQEDQEAWRSFLATLRPYQKLTFAAFDKSRGGDVIDMEAVPQQTFHGDLKILENELERLANQSSDPAAGVQKDIFAEQQANHHFFFVCESATHAERIATIFDERGFSKYNLQVFTSALHHGFKIPGLDLAVFTDHEFYGRGRRLKSKRKHRQGLTYRQLKTLSRGDYIVHVDHGIGVYQGLEKIKAGGHERECLVVHYQDGDKLFVPLDKMDRVQKYTTKEAVAPRIHKLGAPDWERLKKRSKKQIKNIAMDLIKLYAERKSQRGIPFSADTPWQRELEASFEFEDTPDQASSVVDVKKDMEADRPMDRLICGDVGYGKTEVAVRAAFKAVQESKQVAILVPTTLLAQQHFSTFKERLQRYPVVVEVLSRFRKKSEQKKIIERLKAGDIDIIIGTHRLLSKDVEFHDLGLMVIDEEQSFGVRHKEKLKQLKVNVDVLTLSATPIPRTMHMSLMSLRDMSIINTAPRDRLPIHTEVVQYDRDVVRQAILREVHRGGQVFFVHNRVQSIYRVASLIRKLVPEVEVVVAHGQMKESELEQHMLDFMNRKHHVLVSTMIIESGLDMPNVNTIMVNRADRFGLAQLYQLRGRVGRSNQKAFCYLLIPPVRSLSMEAIKRLETIEEFSDLGSGFQIALRDLEIRGAGNLLGAEQSGMIDAIGFDMYTRILEEAVQEAKSETMPEESGTILRQKTECRVELRGDAYLPDDFVDIAEERVAIYRRLAEATTFDDISSIQDELVDRFGRLPQQAKNLLALVGLKILGAELGIEKLRIMPKEARAVFSDEFVAGNGQPFKEWLGSIVRHAPFPIEFFQNGGIGFRMLPPGGEQVVDRTIELLVKLNESQSERQVEQENAE